MDLFRAVLIFNTASPVCSRVLPLGIITINSEIEKRPIRPPMPLSWDWGLIRDSTLLDNALSHRLQITKPTQASKSKKVKIAAVIDSFFFVCQSSP
jgi:hypothetical protein